MSPGTPAAFGETVGLRWRIFRLLPSAGWPLVSAIVLCNVLLGALPVAFIVGTSVMLGRVPAALAAGAGSPEWSAVVVAFVLASVAFAAQQALAPLQTSLGELVTRRVDGRLFDRLMCASMRTSGIGPLEDQRLLDALSEAGAELEGGFQSPGSACAGLSHLVARVVQLAGYVVVIGVAYSWWAAAGVLATVLVFRQGQRGGLRRYARTVWTVAPERRKARYLRGLAMHAPAAKEIRAFGLVGWLRAGYRAAYLSWIRPLWSARRRIMLWPYFWYTGFGLLVTAAVLAALATAGVEGLTLTSLALVIQAVLGCLRLGEFYPEADVQTQYGMKAYEAIRTFEAGVGEYAVATGQVPRPPPRPVPDLVVGREIRFEDVTFRYPGRTEPVLDRLRLTVVAGRCTAIVGLNGAGKTTLVKLLARLYEPQQGRITVGGIDIRSFPVDQWRATVAVILQDFIRYETTAADNIGFGAVDHLHERDQIRSAAADAGVLDAIEALPRGLDTPLVRHATGGTDLSGGQWQRVALARALFRLRHGAGVLVLDEPTANLDVRAEARFFDEFVRITRGSTTILISHRFSTVRHADRILVLERGRISEAGSHDELVRRGGRYAELFRLQADRFAADPVPTRRAGGHAVTDDDAEVMGWEES